ncbi:MAG: hypothetical protein ACOX87_10980 [Chloroflexota bacterium]
MNRERVQRGGPHPLPLPHRERGEERGPVGAALWRVWGVLNNFISMEIAP